MEITRDMAIVLADGLLRVEGYTCPKLFESQVEANKFHNSGRLSDAYQALEGLFKEVYPDVFKKYRSNMGGCS